MKHVTQVSNIQPELCTHEKLLREAVQSYECDNMEVAISQFLALAENDCEEAFLYLSLIYRDGDGVGRDELKAARYKRQYVQSIEAKAESGISAYQLKLAYIFQFGDGVAIDDARAFQLFSELAREGLGEAQFHLSRIYAHGWCGQHVDPELELLWLNEAVKSEWPMALYYSALFLVEDSADSESLSRAMALMKSSAELGCWQAKEYLERG